MPVSSRPAKETWTFNGYEFQTNDLAYTLTSIDIYSGIVGQEWITLTGGLRGSKGEQSRENFYQNGIKLNIGKSVETINAISAFAEISGKGQSSPFSLGYSLLLSYPLSVTTTNNLTPGFEFTSPGYSIGLGLNLNYDLADNWYLSGTVGCDVLHYEGSKWVQNGAQTAKWPSNDTYSYNIRASSINKF